VQPHINPGRSIREVEFRQRTGHECFKHTRLVGCVRSVICFRDHRAHRLGQSAADRNRDLARRRRPSDLAGEKSAIAARQRCTGQAIATTAP